MITDLKMDSKRPTLKNKVSLHELIVCGYGKGRDTLENWIG